MLSRTRGGPPSSGAFRAQGRAGMRCRHRLPSSGRVDSCIGIRLTVLGRRSFAPSLVSLPDFSVSPSASPRLVNGVVRSSTRTSTYFVCCLLLSMLAVCFVSLASSWFSSPICTNSFPLIPAYLPSRTNRTNTHIRIASTFNEHHRSPRIHRSASHRIASHSNNHSPRIIPAAIRTPIIHRLPPHARIRWMMIPRRTRMDRPFPLLPPHTGVIRPRDPWTPPSSSRRDEEKRLWARV
ncbi:hypothetical protein FKP32DRAFT_1283429 [Trametes sanguinea]|nr:hypothetical protein FKP32DRAFT_1283429 [Trametes sanguinea]